MAKATEQRLWESVYRLARLYEAECAVGKPEKIRLYERQLDNAHAAYKAETGKRWKDDRDPPMNLGNGFV